MVSIRQLWVVFLMFTLSACGGGGTLGNDNNNGGNDKTPVYTLGLTIKNSQGQNSNQLSLSSPLVLEATLSATNNGVIAGQLITFDFDRPSLATFANDTGTADTKANGVASIGINVGTLLGAGKITARFGEVSAQVVFTSAGDGGTEVGVQIGSVLLIADKLQLGSAESDKVELSAVVRNTRNNVLSGVEVEFEADNATIQVLDRETGANGIARATLSALGSKENREIKVTARVGQKFTDLIINVVGTQIDIASPQAVVLNDSALIDIFVQDSEGKGRELRE